MSAGDARIIGWAGGATTYRELHAPAATYELSGIDARTAQTKKLTRTLIVPAANVQAVLATLSVTNASISATVMSTAGAASTVTYGGGWTLVNVGDNPYRPGFSELKLEYTKQSITPFEFGLPANLTIVEASGKVTVKYKETTLEVWDSGTGATGSGVEIRLYRESYNDGYVPALRPYYRRWIPGIGYVQNDIYTAQLVVNGVILETLKPDPIYKQACYEVGEYINMKAGEFSARATEERLALLEGQPAGTIIVLNIRGSAYMPSVVNAGGIIMPTNANGVEGYSTDIHDALVTYSNRWMMFAYPATRPDFERFAPHAQLLEWDTTTANHIKLLWAKNVWKDWDVSGL